MRLGCSVISHQAARATAMARRQTCGRSASGLTPTPIPRLAGQPSRSDKVGSEMTDAELLAGFESTLLPKEMFGHRQHVHAGWLFVRRHGMPGALVEFPAALKRFAAAKGAPNLYHETITWAYLVLIHERIQRQTVYEWDSFAAANPDLLIWKPSVLDRYYTAELLWSDLARSSFVMPDRVGPM